MHDKPFGSSSTNATGRSKHRAFCPKGRRDGITPSGGQGQCKEACQAQCQGKIANPVGDQSKSNAMRRDMPNAKRHGQAPSVSKNNGKRHRQCRYTQKPIMTPQPSAMSLGSKCIHKGWVFSACPGHRMPHPPALLECPWHAYPQGDGHTSGDPRVTIDVGGGRERGMVKRHGKPRGLPRAMPRGAWQSLRGLPSTEPRGMPSPTRVQEQCEGVHEQCHGVHPSGREQIMWHGTPIAKGHRQAASVNKNDEKGHGKPMGLSSTVLRGPCVCPKGRAWWSLRPNAPL